LRPILLDTGVIVGLLDRDECYHSACLEAVEEARAPLVTGEAVIAESFICCTDRLELERQFSKTSGRACFGFHSS
jgi:predicted nucleic acid-binding protein